MTSEPTLLPMSAPFASLSARDESAGKEWGFLNAIALAVYISNAAPSLRPGSSGAKTR